MGLTDTYLLEDFQEFTLQLRLLGGLLVRLLFFLLCPVVLMSVLVVVRLLSHWSTITTCILLAHIGDPRLVQVLAPPAILGGILGDYEHVFLALLHGVEVGHGALG